MHPYEVLAEPVRRRLVQILASGEHSTGELEGVVTLEFGIGRSAVQYHLRLLLKWGWTGSREDWPFNYHHLRHGVVEHIESEVSDLRVLWDQRVGWNGEDRTTFSADAGRKGLRGHGRDPDDPWLHVFD